MVFPNNKPDVLLIILIPIALIQGAWVFYDARRRKEKYYWLWVIFGLMNIPSNLLVYLLVTRVILKNKSKN